jgi:hypothetical protein
MDAIATMKFKIKPGNLSPIAELVGARVLDYLDFHLFALQLFAFT